MLTFNLKKEWFDKIKNGEKTHEYREVKPYWTKRLFMLNNYRMQPLYIDNVELKSEYIVFVCGYASKDNKEKRLKAKIKSVTNCHGMETDLKINKDVYDIEFELIGGAE